MAPPKVQQYDKLFVRVSITEKDVNLQFGTKSTPTKYIPLEAHVVRVFSECINVLALPGALIDITVFVVYDDGSVCCNHHICISFPSS